MSQPAVLQVGQAGEPELGALGLPQPQPEQLLLALQIHAQGDVDRVLRDAAVGAADNRINPLRSSAVRAWLAISFASCSARDRNEASMRQSSMTE
jgi:hypothetical protein